MDRHWENNISINSLIDRSFSVLPSAAMLVADENVRDRLSPLEIDAALRDTYPLPETSDREGYFGQDHIQYWLSGYKDAESLLDAAKKHNVNVSRYMDLGCSSGRVLRHFGIQRPDISTIGCDINRLHVTWCNSYLPTSCSVFQNHSIPTIPIQDSYLDLVSAFSVFTHIEAFETTWLMELCRVLRSGGLAWLTFHTELTLKAMDEEWPLFSPVMTHPDANKLLNDDREFSGDRLVLRWHAEQSYSSNVFYKRSYLEKMISSIFEIVDYRHQFPQYQDVYVLRKA